MIWNNLCLGTVQSSSSALLVLMQDPLLAAPQKNIISHTPYFFLDEITFNVLVSC